MELRTARNCPLCGAESPVMHRFSSYQVALCKACDLAFNVYPVEHSLMHLFADQYVDSITAGGLLQRYIAFGRMLPLELEHGGSLLEVGCGVGYFLRAAASKFSVSGLDNSPAVLERARQMCPSATLYESETFPGAEFDVIVGFHMFEHLTDPVGFAVSARNHLKPGGRLYLRVPNLRSAWARLQGRKFFLEGHCSHFTPASLRLTLQKAGFDDIDIYTNSFAGRWLAALAAPLINVGSRAIQPVNRAYQEGRRTPGLYVKRALLGAFHYAQLALDIVSMPLLALLCHMGRGEEIVAIAKVNPARM